MLCSSIFDKHCVSFMAVPWKSAATSALSGKRLRVQVEQLGEGGLIFPAQGLSWMQLPWCKAPLNRGKVLVLAGSAWSMQQSSAELLWSAETLWHLGQLQLPDCSGVAEYRSHTVWGARQEYCHHPKITPEILWYWKLPPVKCCRTLRSCHKRATLPYQEKSLWVLRSMHSDWSSLPGANHSSVVPIKTSVKLELTFPVLFYCQQF